MRCSVALLALCLLSDATAPVTGSEVAPAPRPIDPRKAALVAAGYTPVPLTVGPSFFTIECTVGGERTRFALDTGGQETLLDEKLAEKLKLKMGDRVPATGLGGGLIARRVAFSNFTVGGYDTRRDGESCPALATDLSRLGAGGGGVLGTNALNQWAAVIDYPARTLYLRSPLATAWPRLAGTWAATRWHEDGQDRKLDPKGPPTLTLANDRLRLTDGGTVREYAPILVPNDGTDYLFFFDPERPGRGNADCVGGGLFKVGGGKMTACLFLDMRKAKAVPTGFAAPKGSGFVLLELARTGPAPAAPADPLRERLVKDGFTAVPLDREPDGERSVAARVGNRALRLTVDTGATVSAFDAASLRAWGAKPLGGVTAPALGGQAAVQMHHLRGLRVGEYDTRAAWAVVLAAGADLSGLNKTRAQRKLRPIDGLLGHVDLWGGSAVVDFHANTLYLRPLKAALWPALEGRWTGVAWQHDGRAGRYPADSASTVEFKGGRFKYTAPGQAVEWGFHVTDEGDWYRLGLFDPKTPGKELTDGFTYESGGLLRLSGDRLTLLLVTDPNQVKEEPTALAAPKGSGVIVIEFERAK